MSDLLEYAKREIEILNKQNKTNSDPMSEYAHAVRNDVLELVEVFAKQGHSGMSSSMVLDMFTRVTRYMPLSPLTGEEDEWGTNAGSDQNNRDYAVFKRDDGTAFDLDLDPIYTDDDGKSWFTKGGGDHKDSTVEFPYMPGNEDRPEVYLEKDGDE